MPIQETKAITTQIKKLNRIPTGIYTFDSIIRGGFPSGSLVLLSGDVGAGNREFAYSSAAMLSLLKSDVIKHSTVIAQLEGVLMKDESLKIPSSICYISFSQSKEGLLRELKLSFPPDFAGSLNNMVFKDFSNKCSSNLKIEVENTWLIVKEGEGILYLLKELISTLEFRAPESLVIIDSLTSLMRTCCFDWSNFIRFLEYIQKRSKKWDGLVYLLLGKGILEKTKEEEIMDLADGVLIFDWVQDGFSRQQAIHMKKFIGLMPNLAKDNIVRFDTMVTNTDGFMVINVKHISGRQ